MCNIFGRGPTEAERGCLVAALDRSEAAPAGRLDPDDVARLEVAGRLARQLLAVHEATSGRPRLTAPRALRGPHAALADQREPARLQHAELADHAVAALVAPTPAGAQPE